MTEKGRLVAFEGLSNAGKTTVVSNMVSSLREQFGVEACAVHELSSPVGKALDDQFRSKSFMSPEYKALAFAADRRFLIDRVIQPALDASYLVLVDRYTLTNVVYRGQDGVDPDWVLALDRFSPKPDLTVFLDVAPVTSLMRAKVCGKPRPYDEAYLAAVRVRYLELVESGAMTMVNAELRFDEVVAQCCQRVMASFGN